MPARCFRVEAAAVVAHLQAQAAVRGRDAEPEIAGARMAQHVVDRFLRHAEARGLGVGLDILRRLGGVEMRCQAGNASLAVEVRAQRGGEAQVIELRRAQAEGKLAHPLERVLHGLDALGNSHAQRRIARALQRFELDFQRREHLADVVVQIARQAPALFFLHFQQPPGQRPQPLVGKLKLVIHPLERLLRAQPLGDVVDHDQPGAPPAPVHQVPDAVDVERLAILPRVAKNPAVHRAAGLVAQKIAPLVRAAQVRGTHAEELLAAVAVEPQRRVVHGDEAQGFVIKHPHRQRARFEQHAIAAGLRIDAVDELLQSRGKHSQGAHGRAMVPLARTLRRARP